MLVLLALALALSLGVVTAAAEAATSAVTTCTGTRTAETITGAVVVPSGAVCVLEGVNVTGSVTVFNGGTLGASFAPPPPGSECEPPACFVPTVISGNISARGAAAVAIGFTEVGGSVWVTQTGSFSLDRAFVGGNVTLVGDGWVGFHYPGVDGNLVCSNNTDIVGLFAVFVGGQAFGQCAGATSS